MSAIIYRGKPSDAGRQHVQEDEQARLPAFRMIPIMVGRK
jgi:hypothetical protein